MDILKLTDWNDKEPLTGNIEELLEPLIDYAVKAGIIEDTAVPVSYTHLDVYKRQIYTHAESQRNKVFHLQLWRENEY